MKAVIIIEDENVNKVRLLADKISLLSDEYEDMKVTYCEEEK